MKTFIDNNKRFFAFLLISLVIQILLFRFGDLKRLKPVTNAEVRKFVKIKLSKIYKPAAKKIKKAKKKNVPKPVKKRIIKKRVKAKQQVKPKPKELSKQPMVAAKKSLLPEKVEKKTLEKKKEPVIEIKELLPAPEILVKTEENKEENRSPVSEPEIENDNSITLLKYRQMLLSLIDEKKYYPKSLKRFKRTGEVELRFSMNNKGELLEVTILKPSRYTQFNKAAKEAVRRVAIFPPPPDASNKNSRFIYEVTILFKLA